MDDKELRGQLLARAFEKVLGQGQPGSIAFVRCLAPAVVAEVITEASFAPKGWGVWRVADHHDGAKRTMTADEAVERREEKAGATLLLVDTTFAGAGMDGIYSAALEIQEADIFDNALRLATAALQKRHSAIDRRYAERALTVGRGHGGSHTLSQWAAFDFLCQIAASDRRPGAYLHLVGLWPVRDAGPTDWRRDLDWSRLFVDRLLGYASTRLTPAKRVEALNLDDESQSKSAALQRFLHGADMQPLSEALRTVAYQEDLWIGALQPRSPAKSLRAISLDPWRNRNGSVARWSGLVDEGDEDPPAFVLDPEADRNGRHSTLSVKWKAEPGSVAKNAVEYRVAVLTDMDEEIVSKIVPHRANRGGEQCRFSDDDFRDLRENSRLPAKVSVSVVDNEDVDACESEEFTIRFGTLAERETGSVAKSVRTFSEGLAQLRDRAAVSELVLKAAAKADAKDHLVLRTPVEGGRRMSFKVYRPPLVKKAESDWIDHGGGICRWTLKVRESGVWAGGLKFVPLDMHEGQIANRAVTASHKLTTRFREAGGVGQVYDDKAGFDVPQEYLRAWAALLESGDPLLALAHTVEVQSLSGRTIGLIVLPAHPLRVAWLAAYDNLVFHTAFELRQSSKDIEREFATLDSSMFPAFLPNPSGGAFVFADTLGFHAVGMVPDADKEPKAAMSILAKALGSGASIEPSPTVGKHSAKVLGNEIDKYTECHKNVRLLHVHALRAGDGFTVARSLGNVYEQRRQGPDDAESETTETTPVFSLNLYPSHEQRGVAGRFIAEAREKRRSGAGNINPEDRWMLESLSLPGGVNVPRLRWWAREDPWAKGPAEPKTAAHLAIAFDTFEARVVADVKPTQEAHPFHAFGLMSFYERQYASSPQPLWESTVLPPEVGEKHPSRRGHSEILARLQDVVHDAVARHVGDGTCPPTLKTNISEDDAESLKALHQVSDWVVTLDRNAGIEYFDSPSDNKDVYDAYVIDCVPEREDLGCLQLITSTANLDEVRGQLDVALDQMGLSRSRRNAEFLLGNLKALSGRLAIRLTGQMPATSELIALAVAHANCRVAIANDECWMSLKDGFFIPIDDVPDLLRPWQTSEAGDSKRPDLIFVSKVRTGLTFQFIEVKYRRDLRSARSPDVLRRINEQIHAFRREWEAWYGNEVCAPFRAIRRAKLARVLRFYADKAKRHFLPTERHEELVAEIRKMVVEGDRYVFAPVEGQDRGWIFCPEYAAGFPLKISDEANVFLVGPNMMPDAPATATPFDGQAARPLAERDEEGDDAPSKAVERRQADARGDNQRDRRPNPTVSLGADVLGGASVDWPISVKGNPHLLMAGLPGMGKTTCLVNMCRQMVALGICPIVFSYHQDIDEGIQSVGAAHFLDFNGLGFNPLQIDDVASATAHLDVAGTMRDIFASIFPELGDIQGDRIRTAIKESFVEQGWGNGEVGVECPPFRRFLEILRSVPKPDQGLRRLLARLDELDDYGFFSPATDQRILWDGKQPVVVRIHATQNDYLQRAFASLVFYRLYKDMFHRGIQERITHAIVFDEAHRAARLKLLPTMAKECRKYGVSLVVASQEATDFDASLFSAIANYLVLRLTDSDARFLVRNVASSHQEKALLDRIKELDRFRAMFFQEGERRPCALTLHSEDEGRVATAIKYYQGGKASTGAAAELAGIPKPLLLMKLSDYGIVTFDMSAEEIAQDLDNARGFL